MSLTKMICVLWVLVLVLSRVVRDARAEIRFEGLEDIQSMAGARDVIEVGFWLDSTTMQFHS